MTTATALPQPVTRIRGHTGSFPLQSSDITKQRPGPRICWRHGHPVPLMAGPGQLP